MPLQVGLMLVMAFMSYYVSTLCGLSGILTIFICGIIDSHYTWYNLNDLAKVKRVRLSSTLLL